MGFDSEYAALRNGAGVVDLTARGKLALTGADRLRFLHGMVTNEIEKLSPGEGNYCFMLNAQGQIQADLNVLVQNERLLLDCEPFVTEKVQQALDHYIIMDEVEMANVSQRMGTIAVEGPLADRVISACGYQPPPAKPLAHVTPGGDPDFVIARITLTGSGIWLIAPVEELPALKEKLRASASEVGPEALETVRIEAGIPRYGVDIDAQNIPQETDQLRAISFNKGCYIGQEIVERVRSRGHVNRKLVGLAAPPGAALRAGMKLRRDGKEVGHITSTAFSPALGRHIALGYVRREHLAPGTMLDADPTTAEVTTLPFLT